MTQVTYGPNGEFTEEVSEEELHAASDILDALVAPSVMQQRAFTALYGKEQFTYLNAASEMGQIVLDLTRDHPERAVANSSRPLTGTQIERDDWGHGRWWFYGDFDACVRSWKSDDAYLVVVVTNDEIREMIRADYRKHQHDADEYAKSYDEMGMDGWEYMASNHTPYLPYVK